MKKILLATTALVGMSFVGQAALADGFSVSGGVDFRTTVDIDLETKKVLKDPADPTSPMVDAKDTVNAKFKLDSYELKFKAEKELDSGLTAGMVLELETKPAGTIDTAKKTATTRAYDKFYGYLKGAFGEIQMGHLAGADDQLAQSGWAGGGTGVIDGGATKVKVLIPNGSGEKAGNLTILGSSSDDDVKLAYFSPEFYGVKGGVSYALAGRSSLAETDGSKPFQHKVGVGASYSGDYGNAGSLAAGVGFALHLNSNSSVLDNVTDMGVKLGLKYTVSDATIGAGFSLGVPGDAVKAKAVNAKATGVAATDSLPMAFQVSASYKFGAGDVGAGFAYGLQGDSKWLAGGAGVGYSIVDGFKTSLDVVYSSADNGGVKGTAKAYKASNVGVVVSAAVSF